MRRALCPGLPDLSQADTHLIRFLLSARAQGLEPDERALNIIQVVCESETSTPDQIVSATRKLSEDRGIAHITTKQIAQTAGCAEGMIFRHLERKEDLLLAAVLANFPSFKESLIFITGGVRANPPGTSKKGGGLRYS